jgi:hypothetical protein
MVIKKCCAPAERFNTETKSCIPNVYGVPHRINFMALNLTKQRWISDLTSGPYCYTQKSEYCKGILKTDSNYRVTQEGKLVNYAGDDQSYYEFFNDFCADINYKSGESIAIICENKKVIKKCCEKTLRLQEKENGEFTCDHTDEPIFLNDISEIFNSNESSENYEFSNISRSSFQNYLKFDSFFNDHFQFDGNLLEKFKNESEFCLDKLDDRWIVLGNKINDREVRIDDPMLLFLANTNNTNNCNNFYLYCSILINIIFFGIISPGIISSLKRKIKINSNYKSKEWATENLVTINC